ncbi:hypothetical protein CANINC_000701 [Pichia inconspicua]|uniref:DNA damage-binding protein 1 n=1 Tax=Pichia inconspicua TaxID=52247 RepID=A0A4T0X643_9ASCO|nr:hypothetical protein CANINC_000701 [[Candida] inconspicua]
MRSTKLFRCRYCDTSQRRAMADINPDFSLYHLTLQSPSGSIKSIVGNFSGDKKVQEIVRATQTSIELWKFDKTIRQVIRQNVTYAFANLRNIFTFRPLKSNKDLIVVTSDAGMLTIIEYDNITNKFVSLVNEAYFKTGISRLAAGEYICVDPKGRAILIAAIEKNKLVYTLIQDDTGSNQLSSPVEFKMHGLLTFDITALDVGYENPIFAGIEVDYSDEKEKGQKRLNYYEFDLGLNSISILESRQVESTANHVVAIPGGVSGPSGILLCSEGWIEYMCPFKPSHRCRIPVREQPSEVDSVIVASVVHKMKNEFFVLLQNQFGDIFKVTLDYSTTQETRYDVYGENVGPGLVTTVKIRYFDTIPLCTSMIVLKNGYLFADFENGDKGTYQFEKLGDGSDEKEWSSNDKDVTEVRFIVKVNENIKLVDTKCDFNQMIEMKVSEADFVETLPELYAVTGTKERSAVKVLHNYLPLTEIVTQDLPSKILNAFTTKMHKNDTYDKFIVLSFFDGSLILQIGDEVEEAENSGFIDSVSTLDVAQIGEHTITQIHATGLKQIFYSEKDEPVKETDWNPPPGIEVIASAWTNTQIVIALSNGDIVYFEKSESGDALVEYMEHKEFNSSITGVCIGEIPVGRIRAPFIIVTCKDASVHVLSTDPKKTLHTVHATKLHYRSSSIAITTHRRRSTFVKETDDEEVEKLKLLRGSDETTSYVHAGLDNGIYTRFTLTEDGILEDKIVQFVVAAPLKIRLVKVTSGSAATCTLVCLNSTISFFVIPQLYGVKLVPLPVPEKFIEQEEDEDEGDEDEEEKVYAKQYGVVASLHSNDVPQGLLLTHGDRLSIVSVPAFTGVNDVNDSTESLNYIHGALSRLANIESIPLRYTPRAMCTSVNNGMAYIACADADIDSPYESDSVTYGSAVEDGAQYSVHLGDMRSCVHVYSNEKAAVGQSVELPVGEMAYRLGTAILERDGVNREFLFVSTTSGKPPVCGACFLRVYVVEEDGSLSFLYKHAFERPVLAIHGFQGHVAVGVGSELALYKLGKVQLLKKGAVLLEEQYVRDIVTIASVGDRLFIGDVQSSVRMIEYDVGNGSLTPVIDDMTNRHVTRSVVLDDDTVLVGDKFGNVTTLRVPDGVNVEVLKVRKRKRMEKFKLLSSFYVGDVITSLNFGQIGIGGEEVVVYGGINGTVGTFSAMKTIKEVNFFRELEKLVREMVVKIPTLQLIDRDVRKFRSYYVPKRACIDGDLVELYLVLDKEAKAKVADALDRTVEHVEKRVLEMRSRVGFG